MSVVLLQGTRIRVLLRRFGGKAPGYVEQVPLPYASHGAGVRERSRNKGCSTEKLVESPTPTDHCEFCCGA
jgi:hypothetical protein